MPWRRVEQYIVEVCRKKGIECERGGQMGRYEREALELLRDFTTYRREQITNGE